MASQVLYHDTRHFFRLPGLRTVAFGGLAALIAANPAVLQTILHERQPASVEPGKPPAFLPPAPSGAISIKANWSKQFWVDGTILGSKGPVVSRFLIDTGADKTTITQDVAKRLGLRDLKFTEPHSTANGEVKEAATRLKSLEVAGVKLDDVDADVGVAKMNLSVLGMSWISQFDMRCVDGVMTLTPKQK